MLVRCLICEKRKYDETECELVPIGPGDRWASIRYGYKCPECAALTNTPGERATPEPAKTFNNKRKKNDY